MLVHETSLTYLFRAYCWRANVLHTLLLSSDSKFFFRPDCVHYLCQFYSSKLLFYSLDKGAPFRLENRKNSCFFFKPPAKIIYSGANLTFPLKVVVESSFHHI